MNQCRKNIRCLIQKPETSVIKPPLYRSIYADSVRRAYEAQKDSHRTMGHASVYSDPSKFLRAHTKPAYKKPFVDKIKICTKNSAEKPPLPKLTCAKIRENKTPKNIIQANIIDVMRKVPPLPKHRVQDTRNGHVVVLDEARLEPTYMSKKSYGKTPVYLIKMAKEKELAKQKEEERIRVIKPPLRHLPKNERQELLNGLNTNRSDVIKEYSKLPLTVETLVTQKKKVTLERELDDLEKYITLLERNLSINVCQDA